MHIVIADDFTGAAELAGIGLRYGLRVELQTEYLAQTESDLLVIDSNTRSRSPEEAREVLKKITGQLQKEPVALLYKKTDSVLRGHVLVELEVLLSRMNRNRVLLVPSNPSFGRTLTRGRIFIGGKPLHETKFATDPEFPSHSSEALNLLGKSKSFSTFLARPGDDLPEQGIVVGEVARTEDLVYWSRVVDEKTIPAGASEFFQVLLQQNGYRPVQSPRWHDILNGRRVLFVCGSSARLDLEFLHKAQERGFALSDLPCPLKKGLRALESCRQNWVQQTLARFQKSNLVMLVVNQPLYRDIHIARQLTDLIARVVAGVEATVPLDEMLIEGGSTASAVLRRLHWQRWVPEEELTPGVVRLHTPGKRKRFITVKPGSYSWPQAMWRSRIGERV